MATPWTLSPRLNRPVRRIWWGGLLGLLMLWAGLNMAANGMGSVFGWLWALSSGDFAGTKLPSGLGSVIFGCAMALFTALGWSRSLSQRRRQRALAKQLSKNGKLISVLVLASHLDELGFESVWRYRYLTPLGCQGSDVIQRMTRSRNAPLKPGARTLALCSLDEQQSVLIASDGFPLAKRPAITAQALDAAS